MEKRDNQKGRVFGAILAGGSGERMKISDVPKQFLQLGDRPIIIHTLEKFLLVKELDAICVGVHPQWKRYFSDLLKDYIDASYREKIHLVDGGENRNDTIENIMDYIEEVFSLHEEDVLMTHDAVRPFVSLRILHENLEKIQEYNMIDTAISAYDTVVVSEDGKFIKDIPTRKHMYLGQTPQTFSICAYRKHYNSLTKEEKDSLTDACKVFVLRDDPVAIVRGDEANIKITTANDLKLANALLSEE